MSRSKDAAQKIMSALRSDLDHNMAELDAEWRGLLKDLEGVSFRFPIRGSSSGGYSGSGGMDVGQPTRPIGGANSPSWGGGGGLMNIHASTVFLSGGTIIVSGGGAGGGGSYGGYAGYGGGGMSGTPGGTVPGGPGGPGGTSGWFSPNRFTGMLAWNTSLQGILGATMDALPAGVGAGVGLASIGINTVSDALVGRYMGEFNAQTHIMSAQAGGRYLSPLSRVAMRYVGSLEGDLAETKAIGGWFDWMPGLKQLWQAEVYAPLERQIEIGKSMAELTPVAASIGAYTGHLPRMSRRDMTFLDADRLPTEEALIRTFAPFGLSARRMAEGSSLWGGLDAGFRPEDIASAGQATARLGLDPTMLSLRRNLSTGRLWLGDAMTGIPFGPGAGALQAGMIAAGRGDVAAVSELLPMLGTQGNPLQAKALMNLDAIGLTSIRSGWLSSQSELLGATAALQGDPLMSFRAGLSGMRPLAEQVRGYQFLLDHGAFGEDRLRLDAEITSLGARQERIRQTSIAGLAQQPLGVERRESLAEGQFQIDVLSRVPGSWGSLRGSYQRQMHQIDEAIRDIGAVEAEALKNARPGEEASVRHLFAEQRRALASEQAGLFQQLSYGWENRIIGSVLGTPGSFSLLAGPLSSRAAIGAGVRNPHLGSNKEDLPEFLQMATNPQYFSRVGASDPESFGTTALTGGKPRDGFGFLGGGVAPGSGNTARDIREALNGLTITLVDGGMERHGTISFDNGGQFLFNQTDTSAAGLAETANRQPHPGQR